MKWQWSGGETIKILRICGDSLDWFIIDEVPASQSEYWDSDLSQCPPDSIWYRIKVCSDAFYSNIATPQLELDPKIIYNPQEIILFVDGENGELIDTEPVSITNTGQDSILSVTLTASTADGGNWLSVTPTTAEIQPDNSYNFDVTGDAANLINQTYSGMIAIAHDAQNQFSPIEVPVIFTVNLPPALGTAWPSDFDIQLLPDVSDTQYYWIGNQGNSPLDWEIEADPDLDWLSFSQTSGNMVASGDSFRVDLTFGAILGIGQFSTQYYLHWWQIDDPEQEDYIPTNVSMEILDPTKIDTHTQVALPQNVKSYQNYPNPFNPETIIDFEIPQDGVHLQGGLHLTLNIYDISGKFIRRLINKPMEPGYHTVIWDGRDENGHGVASGMYFYKLHINNTHQQTKQMLLLK